MGSERPEEKRTEKIIEAREMNINRLFSHDFMYRIPFYQRPFSWGATQFEQLIDDINDSMNSVEGHFLGSILLQERSIGKFDLVDGQQRMTALAILMAVIRDSTENADLQTTMQSCIYQEANKWKQIPEAMRITPWEKVQRLFREYIYFKGGTGKFLEDFGSGKISYHDVEDPEFHLFEAITTFRSKMPADPKALEDFVIHMLNHVYMVHMITKSELSSAFRLFHTLNTAGLDLSASDILKAENLGVIKEDEKQKQYADIWQTIEEDLGRSALADIIGYIRTIKKKEKAKLGIYEEYVEIFESGKLERGPAFIDYVNEIAAIYKAKILNPDVKTSDPESRSRYKNIVNLMVTFVPFTDWIPPLLTFYHKFRSDERLPAFISRLEKKMIVEWAAGFSETERITSIIRLVKLVEEAKSPEEVAEKMLAYKSSESTKTRIIDFVNDEEVKGYLKNELNDQRFYFLHSGKFAKYMLLRIDMETWEMENFAGYPGTVTVEHILPQHPEENGPWEKLFEKKDRDEWTNKLGNLVLLSGRKNSRAQNYEFQEKKDIYFKEKSTYFKITRELEGILSWDPTQLKNRHTDLVNRALALYSG